MNRNDLQNLSRLREKEARVLLDNGCFAGAYYLLGYKDMLTQEMIQAGADLMHRLDAAHLEVNASLWLYIPDANLWRFVIVSPVVKDEGPKRVYQKIQSVLSQTPDDAYKITLSDISVVETTDPLVTLLRTAVKTGMGISGRRFSRNTINGHFIEDAYLYRAT